MFRTAEDLPFDLALVEDVLDLLDDEIDEVVALVQLLMDIFDEELIGFRLEVFEAEVFQLALDLRNTQPAGKRRIDVQRLLRHLDLPLFGKEVQRPHIMQAVGKFDDDDADILRHRDEYLAEVFRLLFLAGFEDDLVQLRDAGNEFEDLLPEVRADVLLGDGRILYHVVQEGRGDGGAVKPQLHEYLRDGAGVNKIRLSRCALLPAVRLLGIVIGADEHLAVGSRVIVVDHLQSGRTHPLPSFSAHTPR